ncbi:MAG: PEP-CTERM sorting domain-containing protein [Verrucomicrobia bacterium]|nr:PEP-CTERM sorting domain-containing protein [Verrucomicrobiota bacterium]
MTPLWVERIVGGAPSSAFGRLALALTIAALACVGGQAGEITSTDIVAIPQSVTASGSGTLDLRMFTFSGSEIANSSGAFNGDNGNNSLPQGGGADVDWFVESYVTTAGEVKAFYNLNFPAPGSIFEIVLFLDLNETGAATLVNSLDRLDIVLNPISIQGNPNPFGDVSSAQQAAINQLYTGGTTIASLNPQPAANLPLNSQGAGFADYAIFTGVNPFTLEDSDVLLFNLSMSSLNNGAEELFLSGKYAPKDIVVPEPGSLMLLLMGGVGLVLWYQRRLTCTRN